MLEITFLNCLKDWLRESNPKIYIVSEEITIIKNNYFKNSKYKKIIIPYGVKKIGANAFECCSVEEIYISHSVSSIGEYAFSNCYKLRKINIPPLITTLEKGLFDFTHELKNIIIPEAVAEISNYVFSYSGIKHIQIPSKLNIISELTIIPSTIKIIRECAFSSCHNLSEIIISEGVEIIEDDAFFECYNLKKIKFPSTLKYGHLALDGCDDLEEIIFDSNIDSEIMKKIILSRENIRVKIDN